MGDASSNVFAAPKPTEEAPKEALDVDAQSAEELVASMLRDSLYPDVGEDRQSSAVIPTSEPIMLPPLDLDIC